MNYRQLGAVVRDLRKERSMTQQQLCDGICSQGLLSRIEHCNIIPASDVLHGFATRLDVDIRYFFDSLPPSQ